MNIELHSLWLGWVSAALFILLSLAWAAAAARMLRRSFRRTGDEGKRRGDAILGLVLATISVTHLWIIAATFRSQGVAVAALSGDTVKLRYQCRLVVLRVSEIESLNTWLEHGRGARRTGSKMRRVVVVKADGEEHRLWCRYYHTATRAQLEAFLSS
jgi:hypothetical protein